MPSVHRVLTTQNDKDYYVIRKDRYPYPFCLSYTVLLRAYEIEINQVHPLCTGVMEGVPCGN